MTKRLAPADLADMFRNATGYDSMPPDWTPVGAWVRVSSGAQDEENQVPAVMRHCIDRQWWPSRWYVVHGKSAYHGEHQGDLDRALEDMRKHITTVLVCWHSDRIERRHEKGYTLLNLLAEFIDAGGRVDSVQEPGLGQLDFGGQVTTFITGLVNNEKSKHIAQQVGIALDRCKANGAVRNNVPWGFEITGEKYNKQMVPTAMCVQYAPKIFTLCADGESLRSIAAWLDAEGVPTYRGGKWNESAVRWIIKNRAYAGRYLNRAGKTIMTCEAVITPALFDRANKALKSRPKRGPRTEPTKRPILAALKCNRCLRRGIDSPMYRTGHSVIYYRCAGRGPQRKGCGNMIPLTRLEHVIVVRFLAWNDKPYEREEWEDGKNWDSEIAEVSQDIRELALEPLTPGFADLMAELSARLIEYDELNKNRETGEYKPIKAFNADGSVITIGQHFYDQDAEGRRKDLMTHDISAEKLTCCDGMLVVIDGQEDEVHKESCAYATAA